MALNFVATEKKDLTPRITVFGVGGAGGNAVNNMIEKNLEGVDFVVANTDAQALQQSQARHRIQLGIKVTEGLGAGARPEIGASAASETLEEIVDHLAGAHMCFITAGMGGGTGTGAAPIIAQAARDLGVLTVGVVTKPFAFEGGKRMKAADLGVEELQKVVDTLIVIPNQNLFRLANERTTCSEAFAMADDVLYQGVKGVTDLMVRPGMINLDFADVRAVMDEMGKAMMGTGEASGEDRAREAAEKAIANPLLDEISLNGAKGVLINITGGMDLTLYELDEAANLIREKVDAEANIIVGSTMDPTMEGSIRVSVVATGIEASADAQTLDVQRRRLAEPLAPHQQPAPQVEETYQPTYEDSYDDGYAAQADYRPEYRDEPSYAAPRQPEPAMFEEPAPVYRTAPAPVQPPVQVQPSEPVQDEFDLEDILGGASQSTPATQPRAHHQAPRPVHEPQREMMHEPVPSEHFVTPQPRRAPGQPSPEVLARLNAAVSKRPDSPASIPRPAVHAPRPVTSAPSPQPVAQPAPQSAGPQNGTPERSRLGGAIGGILGRMTGGARDDSSAQHRGASPALRAQRAYDDEPAQHESDRIEIPAFLRRQAN